MYRDKFTLKEHDMTAHPTPPERELVALRDKTLKFKKARKADPERCERLREMVGGDECKLQFILWAEGTSLDIGGIHHGEPVFRPAICAWEAWKAAFTRAATLPQAVSDQDASEPIWTKVKPFAAGVYGVRGYQLGVAPVDQFEAIVAVRRDDDGELVCNMHECTTEEHIDRWGLVSDISDEFEWCRFVPDTTPPPAELGKGDV